MRTQKGRYFAEKALSEMISNGWMQKEDWDRYLEWTVANKKNYKEVVAQMLRENVQPDESSMLSIVNAYLRANDVEAAMDAYRLQKEVRVDHLCAYYVFL